MYHGRGGRSIEGVQIVIDVAGVDPLQGEVSGGGEAPVAFCGWLPLLGIMERLTASAGLPPDEEGGQLGAGGH